MSREAVLTVRSSSRRFILWLLILGLLAPPLPTTSLTWTTSMNTRVKSAVCSSCITKKFKIRSAIATDLPAVANMLATASIELSSPWTDGRPKNGFMARLEKLWTTNDIEQLLMVRHKAIQVGKKQMQQYSEDNCEAGSRNRLTVLWKSDSFRKLVYRAATETGEPNIWRNHDYQLPPSSMTWLQHLQMTACDPHTGRIVGFCELAMLSNPTCSHFRNEIHHATPSFAPAILNLCVDVSYRRRGLAKRMITRAERYASLYWQANSLGLFVRANNLAALALYANMGYRKPEEMALFTRRAKDTVDDSGKMLYLRKHW
jgi:ribosomal protein S18 acetylase RimI-like enzyme